MSDPRKPSPLPPRPPYLAKSRRWPLSPDEPCLRAELHTAAPSDYLKWHTWAGKMGATHKQERCPGCGLWRIWKPKPKARVRA